MRDLLRKAPAWTPAAMVAVAYLALDPRTADLAAQVYRSGLFAREGITLWDNNWYGGHHLPGYSLLFPPLGALLGPRLAGAAAGVAAAAVFDRLPVPRLASASFSLGIGALLFSNRLTFVLGVAFAVGALLAWERERPVAATALGALTALASPVAALFLSLCALAVCLTATGSRERFRAAVWCAAALAPVGALTIVFPSGGTFPFEPDAFWPPLAVTLLLAALIPPGHARLRMGAALYAVLLIAAFALPTQIGGNAVRLGALAGGAVAAVALLPRRPLALALIAPALLFWQWSSPVDDWRLAAADSSTRAGYYQGMLAFLSSSGAHRVEIPFTDNHWEAAHVAPRVALARGWERQLDRKVNRIFYDGTLTPNRFRRWLRENAVDFVALPDAPLDPSAAREAALIRAGMPFLSEAWKDSHWRVFAVRDREPLVKGARLIAIGPDEVRMRASKPGKVLVRVRFSPYWKLAEGRGCVTRAGQWVSVTLTEPGPARLAMSFSPSRTRAVAPRCVR